MAFTRLLVLLLGAATLPLFLCLTAEAREVGVNYGRVANDLPDPAAVVQLLRDNGITMVRIYDTDDAVLRSFANTGIKLMVMLPNENLADAARSPSYAADWARRRVAAYLPATRIHAVSVGSEVFDSRPDLTPVLVPAMTNVQAALAQLGLADAIKVSTPLSFAAVTDSWPPSAGRFRDDIAQPVMRPMLEFLQRTGSYLTINLYPYFAYAAQPDKISRDYFLGNPNPGVLDPDTGLMYYSLLDAQRDATFAAMDKLGFTSLKAQVGETGHPSGGRPKPGRRPPRGGRRHLLAGDDDGYPVASVANAHAFPGETGSASAGRLKPGRPHKPHEPWELAVGDDGEGVDPPAASKANAQAYNNNVMNRVLSGRTGTPLRPDADMDVYIFALFNENQKGSGPDDIEANFGLFYPNMQKVYEFDFRGGSSPSPAPAESWCVANASVGDSWLQAALEYACGHGPDCSAIQPGGVCFEPDTKLAHASYAFNSYYQRNGRANGTCDFNGAAHIVYQEPAGTCDPNASWCVANAAVGDARLLDGLNYACANGADCSAIQPGAPCFEPNTMVAHASHAFNSYYQRNHRASGTCDFGGAASVVYQAPKYGNCVLPSKASIEETIAKSEGEAAI